MHNNFPLDNFTSSFNCERNVILSQIYLDTTVFYIIQKFVRVGKDEHCILETNRVLLGSIATGYI